MDLGLCDCNAVAKSERSVPRILLVVQQQMAARKEGARGGKYLCYGYCVSPLQPPSDAFSPGEFSSSDQVTSARVYLAVVSALY